MLYQPLSVFAVAFVACLYHAPGHLSESALQANELASRLARHHINGDTLLMLPSTAPLDCCQDAWNSLAMQLTDICSSTESHFVGVAERKCHLTSHYRLLQAMLAKCRCSGADVAAASRLVPGRDRFLPRIVWNTAHTSNCAARGNIDRSVCCVDAAGKASDPAEFPRAHCPSDHVACPFAGIAEAFSKTAFEGQKVEEDSGAACPGAAGQACCEGVAAQHKPAVRHMDDTDRDVGSSCTHMADMAGCASQVQAAPPPKQDLWKAMPADVLSIVALKAGCGACVAISGVCQDWRLAVLRDKYLLSNARVKLNAKRPMRWGQHATPLPGTAGLRLLAKRVDLQLPEFVQAAADVAGNGGACRIAANLAELRGNVGDAGPYWRKAAKAGDSMGMFKLGMYYYKGGVKTLGHDPEEAIVWLAKFIKVEQPKFERGDTTDLSKEQHKDLLSQAALMLGYLHLDGEGTKQDKELAVAWFKMAAAWGSNDAEKTLGFLFNTGQFGN